MNVSDNLSGITCSTSKQGSGHSISVLQLATALAFLALPATVLFPTIARPVPTISEASDIQDGLAAAVAPKHYLLRCFTAGNIKRGIIADEAAVYRAYRKYSTLHDNR